jgi:hypothetical protein
MFEMRSGGEGPLLFYISLFLPFQDIPSPLSQHLRHQEKRTNEVKEQASQRAEQHPKLFIYFTMLSSYSNSKCFTLSESMNWFDTLYLPRAIIPFGASSYSRLGNSNTCGSLDGG